MKQYIKYWPYAVIVILILVIIIFKPTPNKDLKSKYETERKEWQDERKRIRKQIENLRADSIEIRTQMAERAKRYEAEARKSNEEYRNLLRKKLKIDLSNSSRRKLDSIRERLYSEHLLFKEE